MINNVKLTNLKIFVSDKSRPNFYESVNPSLRREELSVVLQQRRRPNSLGILKGNFGLFIL
jgi:hypothetical protein